MATSAVVDEFLSLACLTYSEDGPARRARAVELLAENPDLGVSSIHTIAATGNVAAAQRLLDRDPIQARLPGGPGGWEPLLFLAFSRLNMDAPGHAPLEVARLLLDHGADPNAGYLFDGLPSPFTALTGAFGGGEDAINQPPHRDGPALARLLLEAGADPNDSQALYNRQFNPANDHLELLFEYGLGQGDGGPWHAHLGDAHPTPAQLLQDQLLWAAKTDMPDRIHLLVQHGVAVDGIGTRHPVFQSSTAYEVAVIHGNTEIAEMLVSAGATVGALDPAGQLIGACMRGDDAAVDGLTAANPDLIGQAIAAHPDLVARAAAGGRPQAVRLAVRLGFDVNFLRRVTALHEAAWRGDMATVTTLIELGADPTIRDQEFNAPARGWAEHNGKPDVARYLASLEAS